MKNQLFAFLLLAGLVSCNVPEDQKETSADARPNIILIVADDLGYSDISPFGGNINTPQLDRLSRSAMTFSNFHVLPTCSPTRSVLLSGNDNHVAGLGVMGEFRYPAIQDLPGYAGHLNEQVATMPEVLRDAGYHTYMAGKWHLGEDDDQSPHSRGFEATFTLMNGGGSHWADMKPLSPPQTLIYRNHGQKISSLPDDFYSTKNYTDSLIAFIDRNKDDRKPFFAYLSYTAPHDPLHAPKEYIEKYKGMFDSGWDALRVERLKGLQSLGLIPESISDFPANFMARPWSSLTEEQKEEFARDMEVYAAMVDYMDMSIGRLISYLEKNGIYDNSLIIFFSDNGANGASPVAYPGNADGVYLGSFDNSLENRGLPNSFIDMGAGWAQASSSPFRFFKSFTSEGGIKSPMIIKTPGEMKNKGEWNHSFIHVTDILPTIFEQADATYPKVVNGLMVKSPIGKSIMPILFGEQEEIHQNEGMGYELFEMKAYIKGDFKILRFPIPFGTGKWELYNIREDPGEMHDLSDRYPEKKAELLAAWNVYAEQNEVFDHNGVFDAAFQKAYGTGK
jgi:arylsulfatase